MKKKTLHLVAIMVFMIAGNFAQAQTFPSNWKSFDLSKYGMPFSIMAPASTEFDWDGDSEELYLEAPEDNFRMMIMIDGESVSDLVEEAKEETESAEEASFDGYAQNDANGYLARLGYDGATDYELFYVISAKGNTFVAVNNPLDSGMYDEEDAVNMFNACKKAAGK